mmetsp:Transcript_100404/g.158306  ORF Transcript_100404/g.158306 Transcript_100404/m.158306 type:complete len:226 (-) Transcript_100404:111-788(-)
MPIWVVIALFLTFHTIFLASGVLPCRHRTCGRVQIRSSVVQIQVWRSSSALLKGRETLVNASFWFCRSCGCDSIELSCPTCRRSCWVYITCARGATSSHRLPCNWRRIATISHLVCIIRPRVTQVLQDDLAIHITGWTSASMQCVPFYVQFGSSVIIHLTELRAKACVCINLTNRRIRIVRAVGTTPAVWNAIIAYIVSTVGIILRPEKPFRILCGIACFSHLVV